MRSLARATLFLSGLTLLVMILGPLVRAEDAGLACPDWPLCHGHAVPPYEFRVYLEVIHRYAAAILSLCTLAWTLFILIQKEFRHLWKPAVLALALLTAQILLGALTITKQLEPYIVKSHLLNALLFLSCLLYVWHRINRAPGTGARPWITGTLCALIFAQIYLGGRVSTFEAGLACTDFPACYQTRAFDADGSEKRERVFFPPMKGHVEKHMSHRLLAYGIALFLVLALAFGRLRQDERIGLLVVTVLVAVQIAVGAANVLYQIPTLVTVAHSAVAYAIFTAALLTWYRGLR